VGLLLHLQTGTKMIKRTKTLLVTFLLFAIGVLFSCRDREFTYARWELLNNSDYSINVVTYLKTDTLKSIFLPTKGTTWRSEYYRDSGVGADLPPIFIELGNGDSIVVQFSDKRYSYYVSVDPSDKFNIAYDNNYDRIVESNMLYIRRYTFKNEDYENAKPIGQ
jgi:hypothetical protein